MLITLDASSQAPLYQQIVDQTKAAILTGALRSGDPLPSLRQLAADLVTSVITTKRAYQDLEGEGLIKTFQGRGTFVAYLGEESLDRIRQSEAQTRLRDLVSHFLRLGLDADTLTRLFARALAEEVDRK